MIGSNCGNGSDTIVEIARALAPHTSLPILIQPDAGIPENRDGVVVFPESPQYMAERAAELIEVGVAIVGGCCGTTPDHIRALREVVVEIG